LDALDVADIWSEDRERCEDVLEWLVQLLSEPEVTQVHERAMKVLLDNFDVLLESDLVLDVVLCKSDSDEQGFIQGFVHSHVVANKVLPDFTANLDRHSPL